MNETVTSIIVAFVLGFIADFITRKVRNIFDRSRSDGIDDGDNAVERGIEECEGRTEQIRRDSEEIGSRIRGAKERIGNAEKHIERAEEILRGAVERAEKEG